MTKSTKQSFSDMFTMFWVSCVGIAGAIIITYAISLTYDTFNLYLIKQEGFNFASYGRGTGDSLLLGTFSLLIYCIGGSFLFATFLAYKYDFGLNHFKKFIIAIPVVIALSATFIVKFESKESLLVSESLKLYNEIAARYEDKPIFTESTPAQAFKLAIDTRDIDALKVFIKNQKKIKGLGEADMFNKLLTVQNISNKTIRDDFTKIYSDRYITQEEYDSFKNNAMNSIMQTLTTDVPASSVNDKMLIGTL